MNDKENEVGQEADKHLGLVYLVAKRGFKNWIDDDLIQDGMQGMVKAVSKLDTKMNKQQTIAFLYRAIENVYRNEVKKRWRRFKNMKMVEVEPHMLTVGGQQEEVLIVRDEESARATLAKIMLLRMERLNDTQKYVLKHRYGLRGCKVKSLKDVAVLMDVTRQRVQQIEMKGKKELRLGMMRWCGEVERRKCG